MGNQFENLVVAQPEEPIEQWMEFCKFISDGRNRSIQKVASYFGKHPSTIAIHARRWRWNERVKEYEKAQIGSIFAEDRETVLIVQKAMMSRIRFIMETDEDRRDLLRIMRTRDLTKEEDETLGRLNGVMMQMGVRPGQQTDYKALNELIKEAFAIDQGMRPKLPGLPQPAPGMGDLAGRGGVTFNLLIGKGDGGAMKLQGQVLSDQGKITYEGNSEDNSDLIGGTDAAHKVGEKGNEKHEEGIRT